MAFVVICYKTAEFVTKKRRFHAVNGTRATLLVYEMVYLVTAESPSTLPVESSILMTGYGFSTVPMSF